MKSGRTVAVQVKLNQFKWLTVQSQTGMLDHVTELAPPNLHNPARSVRVRYSVGVSLTNNTAPKPVGEASVSTRTTLGEASHL